MDALLNSFIIYTLNTLKYMMLIATVLNSVHAT